MGFKTYNTVGTDVVWEQFDEVGVGKSVVTNVVERAVEVDHNQDSDTCGFDASLGIGGSRRCPADVDTQETTSTEQVGDTTLEELWNTVGEDRGVDEAPAGLTKVDTGDDGWVCDSDLLKDTDEVV